MNLRALFAAVALAAAPLLAAPAIAQTALPQTRGVPVQSITSPSGISAWLVSDKTVPTIEFRAYWKGGSASDPAGKEGLSSFMADMLTEGAGDLDDQAFNNRLQDLNMALGFGASGDGVSMSIKTLSKNRDAAFEMARLALASPRFDAAPLERLKRQALIGIRQRETNAGYIGGLALDAAMIPGHPYARRTSLASVQSITKADMQARMKAGLARSNLQIVVVGDIDAVTLGGLLDKTFASLPATPVSFATVPDASPKPGPALIVKALPQPQSVVSFVAPGIRYEDPDYIPLAVANYILGGGGFSSRLMDEVREKRGLVYGISTSPSVSDHVAYIRGNAQTANKNVKSAIDLIKAEMKRLRDQGPTDAEVADAKTYLTGSFPLSLDSNENIASVLQSYQVTGRGIEYVNKRNALINKVTKADVVRVTQRLFDPDKFVFVVVGQPDGLAPTP
jgi:zinc protease